MRGLLDSLATLAGPLAAAALIAGGGTDVALAACAAASLASALLIARLHYHAAGAGRTDAVRSRDALAGLRLIARDPALRTLTALTTAQTFLRGCVTVLAVVVAIDLLGGGGADVGLLSAAIGAGAVAGSLIASTMSWRGRLARCLGAGVALWGIPLALLGGVPEAAAATLLFAAVGIGNALVDIGVFTLLARRAPDRVLARVFAGFEAVLTLGVAAGAAATPLVIHALGGRGALIALGLVGPAAALAAWPTLRALDRRIVEGGHAEITRNGIPLGRLGHGDGFGEIALLRAGLARTATLRAASDTPLHALALEESRFITAITGYPPASAVADAVVEQRLAAQRPHAGDAAPATGGSRSVAP